MSLAGREGVAGASVTSATAVGAENLWRGCLGQNIWHDLLMRNCIYLFSRCGEITLTLLSNLFGSPSREEIFQVSKSETTGTC
ncbi:MAG: hypothetical protein EBT98_06935 [Opitutaceae bacterium]|nr:hypothetical protein [Opitutaceae bacterium]